MKMFLSAVSNIVFDKSITSMIIKADIAFTVSKKIYQEYIKSISGSLK